MNGMNCQDLAGAYNWSAGDNTCAEFAISTGQTMLQAILYGLGMGIFFLFILLIAVWFFRSARLGKGGS